MFSPSIHSVFTQLLKISLSYVFITNPPSLLFEAFRMSVNRLFTFTFVVVCNWSVLFPGFFNISSLILSRTSSFSSLRIDFKEFLYISSSPGNFPTYIPCIVVYPSRLFPAEKTYRTR